EIDIVITREHVLTQNWSALYDEISRMREASGEAHMKAILATGDLNTLRNVYRASMVAMQAGADFGIKPVGYRALESLRLEKGYRAWGADITPNDSPFEAGLGWAVKLRKDTEFLGRKASEAIQAAPLKKRFVGFTVTSEDVVLLGRETILRNGEAVGYLTSGGFGYTLGKPIGFGYVRHAEGV
ncbi:hypothetical protein NZA98_04565, partial [Escherichia coli]|nr:hypothetical protein [Escherichia coli]